MIMKAFKAAIGVFLAIIALNILYYIIVGAIVFGAMS